MLKIIKEERSKPVSKLLSEIPAQTLFSGVIVATFGRHEGIWFRVNSHAVNLNSGITVGAGVGVSAAGRSYRVENYVELDGVLTITPKAPIKHVDGAVYT